MKSWNVKKSATILKSKLVAKHIKISLPKWNTLYKTVGSVKKKRKKTVSFSTSKWLQMASLLECGNTLAKTLQIMQIDDENLWKEMESGTSFEDLFLANGKGDFYMHLRFFLGVSTLPTAIHSAVKMQQYEAKLWKKLRKESAYPLFIFFFAFCAIYLFSTYLIPQLLNSFPNTAEDNVFILLVESIRVVSVAVFVFVCLFLSALLVHKESKVFRQWCYSHFAFRFGFIKQRISYCLSGYLIQLLECGMSTKQSFQYLLKLQKDTYLSFAVLTLFEELTRGEEWLVCIERHPCLDVTFKQHVLVGANASLLKENLLSYMETQWHMWERKIRYIALIVQIAAYTFVGILMLCVYQIMLLPLQMLEQL